MPPRISPQPSRGGRGGGGRGGGRGGGHGGGGGPAISGGIISGASSLPGAHISTVQSPFSQLLSYD
jgi:hypothetical protein